MDTSLPEECLAKLPSTDEVIVIRRGESGYHATDWGEQADEWVDRKNARLGVTPAQREAMLVGSLFGWEMKGAFASAQESALARRTDDAN